MKKIILYIFIFAVLFLVISCKNTEQDKEKDTKEIIMEDLYFFRMCDTVENDVFKSYKIKINPISKTATYICMDALCDHENIDCPLHGMGNLWVAGNYVFYGKDYLFNDAQGNKQGSLKLILYDMINGNIKQIAEYYDTLKIVGGTESYLYYYIPEYNEEDVTRVDYTFYRADAKTGNIIELFEHTSHSEYMSTTNYPNLLAIINDKIYWFEYDNDSKERKYYTTDLEGKNKALFDLGVVANKFRDESKIGEDGRIDIDIEIRKDGKVRIDSLIDIKSKIDIGNNYKYANGYLYASVAEFVIFLELSDYERNYLLRDGTNLYRKLFLGNEEEELIAEHIIDFFPHGDKIYYIMLEENPVLVEYNGVDSWNWSGGKIYVMNSDGSDKKLLCETGYNLDESSNHNSFIDIKTIDGVDYIAWSYSDSTKESDTNTIIINASTGEYTVVFMPE